MSDSDIEPVANTSDQIIPIPPTPYIINEFFIISNIIIGS